MSSVASAWSRRAAWSGYARALQLQSVEIDEIDVFSWGCGLQIPDRPRRSTTVDLFEAFEEWTAALNDRDALAWRDALPTAIAEPAVATEHPAIVRALDQVRQHARCDGTIFPWLGLPFALRDMGLAASPLACLAGGAKAFRLKRKPDNTDWIAILRSLEAAAGTGLERLDRLERFYRDAQRAIVAQFRPGALPGLLALTLHRPLGSPQSVADCLGITVAGASKLLERAAEAGVLVEITKRRSWRLFLPADLATEFGYTAPKRGRPVKEPSPQTPSRDLACVFDAFDQQMAEFDARFGSIGS